MFEQLVESSSKKKAGRRWMYFGVTALGWVTVMASVVVAGVLAYDARLSGEFENIVMVGPPLPVPLIKSTSGPQPKNEGQRQEAFVATKEPPDGISEPSKVPPIIAGLDPLSIGSGSPAGDPNGSDIGSPVGVLGAPPSDAPRPPDPQPEPKKAETKKEDVAAVPSKPIRKSEGPLQGSAINRVEPGYPRLASHARITGAVVVEVLIDERGNVASARALSGHALLRQAAVSAARGWRWRPTTLNGVPVQVIGTITFNFIL